MAWRLMVDGHEKKRESVHRPAILPPSNPFLLIPFGQAKGSLGQGIGMEGKKDEDEAVDRECLSLQAMNGFLLSPAGKADDHDHPFQPYLHPRSTAAFSSFLYVAAVGREVEMGWKGSPTTRHQLAQVAQEGFNL